MIIIKHKINGNKKYSRYKSVSLLHILKSIQFKSLVKYKQEKYFFYYFGNAHQFLFDKYEFQIFYDNYCITATSAVVLLHVVMRASI